MDYSTLGPTDFQEAVNRGFIEFDEQIAENEIVNFSTKVRKLYPSGHPRYDLQKYNDGILGLGVDTFMSAAVQFCENEARQRSLHNIISVGYSDGSIETDISETYSHLFYGNKVLIQVVPPDSIDLLIKEYPFVVGYCAVLIIWPKPDAHSFPLHYDLDAIRKLQPNTALTIYESSGISGSDPFRDYLHDPSLDQLPSSDFGCRNWKMKYCRSGKESYGLNNYSIQEIARQKLLVGPKFGTAIVRMVKLNRIPLPRA